MLWSLRHFANFVPITHQEKAAEADEESFFLIQRAAG